MCRCYRRMASTACHGDSVTQSTAAIAVRTVALSGRALPLLYTLDWKDLAALTRGRCIGDVRARPLVIDMPHGELLCEKAMHSIANLSTGCIARDVGGPFVDESLCSAKLCNRLRATWRGCRSIENGKPSC